MNCIKRVIRWAAAPVVALTMALAGTAGVQASITYEAGSCKASGQYATCVAGANTYHPYTIRVHVETNRSQRLRVYWDVVCSKGTGAGSRSGSFSIWAPAWKRVGHNISHPYTYPASCTISADSQISKGSYLHVWNTYHRW